MFSTTFRPQKMNSFDLFMFSANIRQSPQKKGQPHSTWAPLLIILCLLHLRFVQRRVDAALFDERLVVSSFNDFAFLQHQDFISRQDRRKTMRNDQARAFGQDRRYRFLDGMLRDGVQGRSRFIEND